MVLVALHHRIRAVDYCIVPLRLIFRNRIVVLPILLSVIPASVCFQVRLINDIDTILIAEVIQIRMIRIMRSTDCVNVVPLHVPDIRHHLIFRYGTAMVTAELMTVHTIEHDALAVNLHQTVLHLKCTESEALCNNLSNPLAGIIYTKLQQIEVRVLRTPQLRFLHLNRYRERLHQHFIYLNLEALHRLTNLHSLITGKYIRTDFRLLSFENFLRLLTADGKLQIQLKLKILIFFVRFCLDEQVFHVNLRSGHKLYLTENTGQTPEVLIFQPASRTPLKYLHRKLVLTLVYRVGNIKLSRSKTIL